MTQASKWRMIVGDKDVEIELDRRYSSGGVAGGENSVVLGKGVLGRVREQVSGTRYSNA